MYKALNAWSIPPGSSFEDAFSALSEAGFDGIELNVDADNTSGHSLTLETSDQELAYIRQCADAHGLQIHSISTSLLSAGMGSPDSSARQRWRDGVQKQIYFAESLGADTILQVPGGQGPDHLMRAAYECCIDSMERLKDTLDQSNVRIGLENVWNGFFSSAFDMCRFIDRVDHPSVGAYFDVGNVMAFSDPEHWIDILGDRIFKVHVKDFRRTAGYHRGGSFVNLLNGDVRWSRVMSALQAIGYDGYLTAELDLMPTDPTYLYILTARALDLICAPRT